MFINIPLSTNMLSPTYVLSTTILATNILLLTNIFWTNNILLPLTILIYANILFDLPKNMPLHKSILFVTNNFSCICFVVYKYYIKKKYSIRRLGKYPPLFTSTSVEVKRARWRVNKHGDPSFLLQFFNVHIMNVNHAKFPEKFDSRTISRELPEL